MRKQELDHRYEPDFVYSDDLYKEIHFGQLYNEFKRCILEINKMKHHYSKNSFSKEQIKNFCDPYIRKLERNLRSMHSRLMILTEHHIERIQEIDP